jgi:cytochrome b561
MALLTAMSEKINMWKNTKDNYGLVSKLFHWLTAFSVIAMFGLGYWMVELTYYSQWYQTAPHWHESAGILLFISTLARLIWRWLSEQPQAIATHSVQVKRASLIAHLAIYSLMIVLMMSGYFISTADERPIEVFNWFNVVGLGELIHNQEDVAGNIHFYAAYALVGLSLLHGLAAIKHHVIDKDNTLKRMIK